jgi:hypothetical protein
MVVLALVLLILVLVFSVAIVVSNPDVYQLSLFRVLVPVTSAGVFFTGFGAALITIVALLLLRTGIRRSRETRRRLRAAEPTATGSVPGSGSDELPAGRSTEPDSSSPNGADPDRPSASPLDLAPGEDRTTAAVDRSATQRDADDRDKPRT